MYFLCPLIKVKIRAFPRTLQVSCGKQSVRVSSLLYISVSLPKTIVKPVVSLTLRTFCRLTWSNFSLSNFSLIHFSLSETTTATESAVSRLPPGACAYRLLFETVWGEKAKVCCWGCSWSRTKHAYVHISGRESACVLTLILRGLRISCLIQRYSASLNYIWWSFHTEVSKCRCHGLCVFPACRFQTTCCSISTMLWSSPVELYWLLLLISALLHIRFFTRLSHCTRLKPRVAPHPWQPSCQSNPYLWMFHIPRAQVRIRWIL